MLNHHWVRHIGNFPGVSCLPAFSCYIPIIKVDTSISIFDVHGLPYTIGMTACAASHAAVNGGAASASWANGNTPVSPSAYKSADREQASSPVCLPSSPSVPFGKPYLLYPFYIPLCTHCFRSVYLSFSIGFIGIDAFHQSMPSRVILLQTNVAWLAVANRPWQKSSLGLHSKRISAVQFAEKPFRPITEAEK